MSIGHIIWIIQWSKCLPINTPYQDTIEQFQAISIPNSIKSLYKSMQYWNKFTSWQLFIAYINLLRCKTDILEQE